MATQKKKHAQFALARHVKIDTVKIASLFSPRQCADTVLDVGALARAFSYIQRACQCWQCAAGELIENMFLRTSGCVGLHLYIYGPSSIVTCSQ